MTPRLCEAANDGEVGCPFFSFLSFLFPFVLWHCPPLPPTPALVTFSLLGEGWVGDVPKELGQMRRGTFEQLFLNGIFFFFFVLPLTSLILLLLLLRLLRLLLTKGTVISQAAPYSLFNALSQAVDDEKLLVTPTMRT